MKFIQLETPVKDDEITALAHLARINIDNNIVNEVTDNINTILGLVDQLQQADTTGVTPMSHPLDANQRLRIDEVSEANQRESLQAIAPSTDNGLFLVPKVIE